MHKLRKRIKVGETFTEEYTGDTLFGIESAGCSGCYGVHTDCDNLPACTAARTPEGVQMKFIRVTDKTAYVAAVLEGGAALDVLFDEFDSRVINI